MALPAGRKGVLPSELTPEGKIKNSGSSYVLPTASADTLGGVKVGSGLSIADGVLSASQYSLPTASADTLGGVKVGSGLSIADGVLSANGYSLPTASADTLGGVKVGSGLSIADGVLSATGGGMNLEYIDYLSSSHSVDITPPVSSTHLYLALPYDGNKEPVIIYYVKQGAQSGWGSTNSDVKFEQWSNKSTFSTTSALTYGLFRIY